MTCLLEDDIVRRALIALLIPEPSGPGASKTGDFVRKKRLRRTKHVQHDSIKPAAPEPPPARICIVEQRTSCTLSISWSDPRSGYYADQVWRLGLAHMASFCVLSGMPIRRGDPVFRPRACERHVPVNGNHMILASAVPAITDRRVTSP